jgi:hypothetical protein
MAALIRRKPDTDNTRDEIPPGTLYLLILKVSQFQRVMAPFRESSRPLEENP